MWLPKDERRLLVGYHRRIGAVGKSKAYRISALRPLLQCCKSRSNVPEYPGEPSEDELRGEDKLRRWVEDRFSEVERIKRANKQLHERGFIVLEHHENEPDVVFITLTLDGYDTARRYTNLVSRARLWFEEYLDWLGFLSGGSGGQHR